MLGEQTKETLKRCTSTFPDKPRQTENHTTESERVRKTPLSDIGQRDGGKHKTVRKTKGAEMLQQLLRAAIKGAGTTNAETGGAVEQCKDRDRQSQAQRGLFAVQPQETQPSPN